MHGKYHFSLQFMHSYCVDKPILQSIDRVILNSQWKPKTLAERAFNERSVTSMPEAKPAESEIEFMYS